MRKLNLKKYKQLLIWSGISLYLLIVLALVAANHQRIVCNSLEISISDSTDNTFIEKAAVANLLEQYSGRIIGAPLDSFNIAQMEELLNMQPTIKNAEIYKTIDGTLRVEIEQRSPVIRVYTDNGTSFYIDFEGNIMPISEKYRPRILIASGYIRDKSAIIADIYKMAKLIATDDFWKAQIVQIYVNKNQEFELIPRVGAQVIQFGSVDNYRYKFRKLHATYFKGLKNVGWNQYQYINLDYDNQVICKKY